jgi:hypothetical protein
MPDLIIENAPEETVRALEALAEQRHMSISEVALEYLPKNAPLSADERIALLRELRAKVGATRLPDSTPLIRRDRDGVSENKLLPKQALALVRKLRATAPKPIYPDSTPGIRADRDSR